MNHQERFDDIGDFIAGTRAAIFKQERTCLDDFDVFANEARFGLSVIKDDLSRLDYGAQIMEIGAGMLLLSGYLAHKGFRVHALEPIGKGFSLFRSLQSALLRHYEDKGVTLQWVDSAIEALSDQQRFDYVFSINVFEHISDIEKGLENAYRSLRTGGCLRIYCPNYLFPYEPHFNIPTLISKGLTERVFKGWIMDSTRFPQARDVWDGLNWINTLKVRRFCRKHLRSEPVFNRMAVYDIARRVLDDPRYRQRRPGWTGALLKAVDRAGLLGLFKMVPVVLSPVMDFEIKRVSFDSEKV